MVNKIPRVLWLLPLFVAFVSCGQSEGQLSWQRYQEWIFDESNDLKKTRNVNDINLSVQYVPAGFLAYREMLSEGVMIDCIRYQQFENNYKCGLTFRVLLEPEAQGVNLLYHRVSDEISYKQRVNDLSFGNSEYLTMKVGDNEYAPVLSNYEGYNEMLNRLVFTAVFQPDEFECGTFKPGINEFTFTFDDPFWGMGVNNFKYGTSTLAEVPQIILN